MLIDSYNREIYYLRVSVTDRCNYRCTYCMSADGIHIKPHDQILRYEQIATIAAAAGMLGFYKIRLTGGEPLIKKNIEKCVSQISATGYYKDISMTTNGSLLTKKNAVALKNAGLHRITISLDTLDRTMFSEITRGGNIDDVFNGISAANEALFQQIKINMVISESTRYDEIEAMRSFCEKNALTLQTIKRFSLESRSPIPRSNIITDRPPKCIHCNRLRLTSDGYLKSCLFSDEEIKVDMNDIEKSILEAVGDKPENGVACRKRYMSQIGG